MGMGLRSRGRWSVTYEGKVVIGWAGGALMVTVVMLFIYSLYVEAHRHREEMARMGFVPTTTERGVVPEFVPVPPAGGWSVRP
jgi:hypothetical protein